MFIHVLVISCKQTTQQAVMTVGPVVAQRRRRWPRQGTSGPMAMWLGCWGIEGWWFFNACFIFLFFLFLGFGWIELGCVSTLFWNLTGVWIWLTLMIYFYFYFCVQVLVRGWLGEPIKVNINVHSHVLFFFFLFYNVNFVVYWLELLGDPHLFCKSTLSTNVDVEVLLAQSMLGFEMKI